MLQEKILETRKAQAEKPAIVVRNVTKEFIIPHERRTTIFENIRGVFSPSTYEKFVAINDISFTVNRGESVGIIGDNGSGKSTLLKIISRILRPTSGSIEINGKITPFLELGVGFQPDMTAKENIEVYSTIMGMSDKEIAGNIDHVLEFAGLSNFRDTKLKNFSSGMQVRLAFATAIQKEPDILLVDEVLAVGDMDFQQKCLDVFRDYKEKGITMLFVSHDLKSVRNFCDKTVLLKQGEMVAIGATNEIIDKYVYGLKTDVKPETVVENAGQGVSRSTDLGSASVDDTSKVCNDKVELSDIKLIDKYGNENNRFNSGDPLLIKGSYHMNKSIPDPVFGIEICDDKGNYCFGANNKARDIKLGTLSGEGGICINMPDLPLLSGKYYITIAVTSWDLKTIYDWHDKKYSFEVINTTNDVGFIKFTCDFGVS